LTPFLAAPSIVVNGIVVDSIILDAKMLILTQGETTTPGEGRKM